MNILVGIVYSFNNYVTLFKDLRTVREDGAKRTIISKGMGTRDLEILKNILQIYITEENCLSVVISKDDWSRLFDISTKQAICGVVFQVIQQLPSELQPSKEIILKFYALSEKIKQYNAILDQSIEKLLTELNSLDLDCCILKGQGVGLLYPNPDSRHPGDIDVWCKGGRDYILGQLKDYRVKNIVIHHADIDIIKGIPIEIHFIPSWFYSPFTNNKFKKWCNNDIDKQFDNYNNKGFCNPTIDFNLVYSIIHIYKHLFDEGIGLRQLMDYYFILRDSNIEERKDAYKNLSSFKMKRFVGAVMYVMKDLFDLDNNYLLCEPSEKYGKHLLNEILIGGNFGQYNWKKKCCKENLIERGLRKMKRNIKFVTYYPSEILWSPLWKCWHWLWRKKNGYS